VGNRYGIGPDGRMRHRKGRVLKPGTIRTGHKTVTLSALGVHTDHTIHALVKHTFDGPVPFEGAIVCHDNGDPADNRLSNLYWGTTYTNSMDTHRHGTNHQLNKDECPLGHRYVEANVLHKTNQTKNGIRSSRECRACDNARCRRTYLKRKGVEFSGVDFKAFADARYAKIMAAAPTVPSQRSESPVPQTR
jgi:hypothetical protein